MVNNRIFFVELTNTITHSGLPTSHCSVQVTSWHFAQSNAKIGSSKGRPTSRDILSVDKRMLHAGKLPIFIRDYSCCVVLCNHEEGILINDMMTISNGAGYIRFGGANFLWHVCSISPWEKVGLTP